MVTSSPAKLAPWIAALLLALPVAAQANHVIYWGGHLLTQAKYINVYWGSYWNTPAGQQDVAYYDGFVPVLVEAPSFVSIFDEYSTPSQPIGPGSFQGGKVIAADPPLTVSDSAVDDFIESQIDAGLLPQPHGDQVYIVYMPPGVVNTNWTQKAYTDFCGYHEASLTTRGGGVLRRIVMPFTESGCYFASNAHDSTTIVLTHEIAESITDPDSSIASVGWRDTAQDIKNGEGEVGDLCHDSNATFQGYAIQETWSNVKNGCVAAATPADPSGGCPAGMHDAGGYCAPDSLSGCSSTSSGQMLFAALGLAALLLGRGARRAKAA